MQGEERGRIEDGDKNKRGKDRRGDRERRDVKVEGQKECVCVISSQ